MSCTYYWPQRLISLRAHIDFVWVSFFCIIFLFLFFVFPKSLNENNLRMAEWIDLKFEIWSLYKICIIVVLCWRGRPQGLPQGGGALTFMFPEVFSETIWAIDFKFGTYRGPNVALCTWLFGGDPIRRFHILATRGTSLNSVLLSFSKRFGPESWNLAN